MSLKAKMKAAVKVIQEKIRSLGSGHHASTDATKGSESHISDKPPAKSPKAGARKEERLSRGLEGLAELWGSTEETRAALR